MRPISMRSILSYHPNGIYWTCLSLCAVIYIWLHSWFPYYGTVFILVSVLFFFFLCEICMWQHAVVDIFHSLPDKLIRTKRCRIYIMHICPSQFRKEYSVLRYSQPFIPKITPINNWMYPSSDCLFWPTKIITFY